jgi:hypothetical protein
VGGLDVFAVCSTALDPSVVKAMRFSFFELRRFHCAGVRCGLASVTPQRDSQVGRVARSLLVEPSLDLGFTSNVAR